MKHQHQPSKLSAHIQPTSQFEAGERRAQRRARKRKRKEKYGTQASSGSMPCNSFWRCTAAAAGEKEEEEESARYRCLCFSCGVDLQQVCAPLPLYFTLPSVHFSSVPRSVSSSLPQSLAFSPIVALPSVCHSLQGGGALVFFLFRISLPSLPSFGHSTK